MLVASPQHGVLLWCSWDSTIVNNAVSDTEYSAIMLEDSSSRNAISNNNVSNITEAGIDIRINALSNTVQDNVIGNVMHGIYLSHTNGNVAMGNHVKNALGNGIDLYHASGNLFLNNRSSQLAGIGIRIWLHSKNNTVAGNVVQAEQAHFRP